MTRHIQDEPILFCDSASGVYIPQRFANEVVRDYVRGVNDKDWEILESGPENEYYWDIWAYVLDNATVYVPENGHYDNYLYQDGDLWVVPPNYTNEDFFQC